MDLLHSAELCWNVLILVTRCVQIATDYSVQYVRNIDINI